MTVVDVACAVNIIRINLIEVKWKKNIILVALKV